MGTGSIPSLINLFINNEPGSDMKGVPASHISEIFFELLICSITIAVFFQLLSHDMVLISLL